MDEKFEKLVFQDPDAALNQFELTLEEKEYLKNTIIPKSKNLQELIRNTEEWVAQNY